MCNMITTVPVGFIEMIYNVMLISSKYVAYFICINQKERQQSLNKSVFV